MYIPRIVTVRTAGGIRYAHFISKSINLQGFRCGVTTINELEHYLDSHECTPSETLIHTRTACPHRVFEVLKGVERAGYDVVNCAETVRITSDKYLLIHHADTHGFKVPHTVVAEKSDVEVRLANVLEHHDRVVVKPRLSRGNGEYCYLFDHMPKPSVLKTLRALPIDEFVLQEYVPYTALYRVIVVGSHPLSHAVFFDIPRAHWKCSVCLNPALQHCRIPDSHLLEMTEELCHTINAQVAFVDWFETDEGWVLNEVNTACNLAIHERVSSYDISTEIANYLIFRLKARAKT